MDLTLIRTVLPGNQSEHLLTFCQQHAVSTCFLISVRSIEIVKLLQYARLITGTVEVHDVVAKLTDYTLIL